MELGLDGELAEESWDLGQSRGQSRGAGAELGCTSGCASPVPQSPCSLCEGCLGFGSSKQRLPHGGLAQESCAGWEGSLGHWRDPRIRTGTGEQGPSSGVEMTGQSKGDWRTGGRASPLPVAVAMAADLSYDGFLVGGWPGHEDEELGDRGHEW